jgi:BCD family chlorophyll transporter-like MFS transporter
MMSLHMFYGGLLLGVGTGLAMVSNLSLMLDMTTAGNVGLFIGAWGMANAISRLFGTILGGVLRDVVTQFTQNPISGYVVVFGIEAAMLVASLLILRCINVQAFLQGAEQLDVIERAAIAGEG